MNSEDIWHVLETFFVLSVEVSLPWCRISLDVVMKIGCNLILSSNRDHSITEHFSKFRLMIRSMTITHHKFTTGCECTAGVKFSVIKSL